MLRSAYVNGRYMPGDRAVVNIEDRGYQFSDGVTEVCEVRDGCIIDERAAYGASLRIRSMSFASPCRCAPALAVVMRECLRRNLVHDGILYLQVTRGVARRDHAFPPPGTRPSVVVTARSMDFAANGDRGRGIAVVTLPDDRWDGSTSSRSRCCPMCWRTVAREKGTRGQRSWTATAM